MEPTGLPVGRESFKPTDLPVGAIKRKKKRVLPVEAPSLNLEKKILSYHDLLSGNAIVACDPDIVHS
jgi:hypothetical protein